MLFHIDSAFGHESQLIPVKIGLANWKSVWHQRLMNNDEGFFDIVVTSSSCNKSGLPCNEPDMWRRPGFWRYASEYWLLAQLYVERLQRLFQKVPQEGRVRPEVECKDGHMSQVKTFIERLQSS